MDSKLLRSAAFGIIAAIVITLVTGYNAPDIEFWAIYVPLMIPNVIYYAIPPNKNNQAS